MGSSSTSWSSESNTHAGSSKAYDSTSWSLYTTTSGLRISGAEGQTAQLELWADEGDDNADKWLLDVADGGSMTWQSYTSGSYAAKLTLSTGGNLTVAGDLAISGGNITTALTLDSTLTVGADTDGHDVKFFGNTTVSYMLWDESADSLIVTNGTADGINIGIITSNNRRKDISWLEAGGTVRGRIAFHDSTSGDASDRLEFGTSSDLDTMVVTNGEVGIGTTAPTTGLTVENSDIVSASFGKEEDTSHYISVVTGNFNLGYAGISFTQNRSSTSSSADIFAMVRGKITSGDTATEITGSLELLSNSGDLLVIGATLTKDGDFGIGTATPSSKLHVDGSFMTGLVTIAATDAITLSEHAGRTNLLGEVGGNALVTLTLPDATGTGAVYKFIVSVVNTSNYKFVVPDANNTIDGQIMITDADGTAATSFVTAAATDTIILNGTTSGGGAIGDYIELTDIAADQWAVNGMVTCAAGSNIATMFSATVS